MSQLGNCAHDWGGILALLIMHFYSAADNLVTLQ